MDILARGRICMQQSVLFLVVLNNRTSNKENTPDFGAVAKG
jgi:hypothetical protein